MNQILLAELRNTTVLKQITNEISVSGTLIEFELEDGKKVGEGSGTLIFFNDLKGILTASHVVAFDKENKKKTFVVPGYNNNGKHEKLELKYYKILTIDDLNIFTSSQSWSEKRLDISLILLDDQNFSKLIHECGKVPINLAHFNEIFLSNPNAYSSNEKKEWLAAIYGHPREDAQLKENLLHLFYSDTYFGGPIFEACKNTLKVPIKSVGKRLSTDLILIDTGQTVDSLPNNFGGMSGGGLWIFALNQNVKIVEKFFAGVFVAAQSLNGKDVKLYSRGPISLYSIFCKFLNDYINSIASN